MHYETTKSVPGDETAIQRAHTYYKVLHEGELVMYAGIEWQSVIGRDAYLWIKPVNLGKRHLRPLRAMLDGLPLSSAIAIIDTSQPGLERWARFVNFEFVRNLRGAKALYKRVWDGT